MEKAKQTEALHDHRVRLRPHSDRAQALSPWVPAQELTRYFLYWMPVRHFPIPSGQRQWLLKFLDRLTDRVKSQLQLRAEVFLQFKSVQPMMNDFLRTSQDFSPAMGLARRPGASLPALPSQADLDDIVNGRKKFDFNEFTPDYAYWFVQKDDKRQRDLFFGHGGLAMILLKPDASAVPLQLPIPPVWREKLEIFRVFDIDKALAGAASLQDSFLKKSKELFGSGLEQEPQFPGLLFILPLLQCEDFFTADPEEGKKWFELFDMYIVESPADGGIVLAAGRESDDLLIETLKSMHADGLAYPER